MQARKPIDGYARKPIRILPIRPPNDRERERRRIWIPEPPRSRNRALFMKYMMTIHPLFAKLMARAHDPTERQIISEMRGLFAGYGLRFILRAPSEEQAGEYYEKLTKRASDIYDAIMDVWSKGARLVRSRELGCRYRTTPILEGFKPIKGPRGAAASVPVHYYIAFCEDEEGILYPKKIQGT